MRFSASRLRTHMRCSLQAHYHYDEGLPRIQNAKASYGSIIHRALQLYNDTGNLEQALALFLDLWANPEKAGVAPDVWPKRMTYGGLRMQGVDTLKAYADKQRFEKRVVHGTEIPFLVPFGEHELHGFIDLLESKQSGTGRELLKVVDFKSNSKEPFRYELALDVQMTVYLYAVSQREFWCGVDGNPDFPGLPNGEWLWETVATLPARAIWYQLSNHKEIDAGPRTTTDFGRLYRLCDEIAHAIELQVFVPTIGDGCTFCDFVDPCVMEIPVAITQLTAATDERWI
jgi:hypothetical protein